VRGQLALLGEWGYSTPSSVQLKATSRLWKLLAFYYKHLCA